MNAANAISLRMKPLPEILMKTSIEPVVEEGAGALKRRILLLSLVLLLSVPIPPLGGTPQVLLEQTWGGSENDIALGVSTDPAGNIYTTGNTFSFGGGSPLTADVIILKYDALRNLAWQRIWGGSGEDVGTRVTTDSDSLYVTGYSESFGDGDSDLYLLKIGVSSGNLLWQKTLDSSSDESGEDVAASPTGEVYVAGYTAGGGAGSTDALLVKFDSSGNVIWQRTWGGSKPDRAEGVALDSQGNIYITGRTESFGAGFTDAFLLKFDSAGSLLWHKTWGNPRFDVGYEVTADSNNVYVTGLYQEFDAGGNQLLVLKFDSTGGLLWRRIWGGPGTEEGHGIEVDVSGNIHIAGHTNSFGAGNFDFALLVLSAAGSLILSKTWGGTNDEFASDLAVDSQGRDLVTGNVRTPPPYSLGTGNSTLGNPSVNAFPTGNSTLGTPSLTLTTPSLQLGTPSGSETYAGVIDAALLIFGEPVTRPSPPLTLTATPEPGRIKLTWSVPGSNGGSEITGYKIYRGNISSGKLLHASPGNVTSYTDTAITTGTTYLYLVRAENALGESLSSNEVSATAQPPSLLEDWGLILILVTASLGIIAASTILLLWWKRWKPKRTLLQTPSQPP